MKDYEKILRHDEDWDWAYFLRLLQYKQERTRKCIIKNDVIVDAPKVARQIRSVEILLERVDKNNYHDEISKDFQKKYGKIRMISGPRKPGLKIIPVSFKYQKETPENSKQIRLESLRLWRKAERMQRND